MNKKYKALFLFAGIGGGALGFQQAETKYRELTGSFDTICGIDVDHDVCKDFEYITGSRAVQMDLFSKKDYIDFHGKEPPEDWKEITPQDLRKKCKEVPDVVFTSPPCKGFSGLLPEKSASSKKYQALNNLTVRGIKLTLEAFKDDLPAVLLIENVPRIQTRGKHLLTKIKQLLKLYGYVTTDNTHDCGEIGALAQSRKRFLCIARNPKKLPNFIYEPMKYGLKPIKSIIESLPMPNDLEKCGKMHRLPNLQFKTWLRLALIPKGKDWRALENIDYTKIRLKHEPRSGAYGVQDWDNPSSCVTSAKGPGQSNTASAVADPRTGFSGNTHSTIYKVCDWEKESGTVTGAFRPNNGAICINDPRMSRKLKESKNFKRTSVCKVMDYNSPSDTVIASSNLQGAGAGIISDPRLKERKKRYPGTYRVISLDEPCSTILGQTDIQTGAISVQDVRLGCKPRSGTFGVLDHNKPAPTIIGSHDVHAGAAALADPRIPKDTDKGIFYIISLDGTWHRPLTTYELAMLQGLPRLIDGKPLELCGKSEAKWRERIGNLVPVQTATGIATTILNTLLMNEYNDFWQVMPSVNTDIWVDRDSNVI